MSSGLSSVCFFPLLIFSFCAYSWAGVVGDPSAYDVLQQYDFPVGLLPEGVTWYSLNPGTNEFSASFSGTCSFTLPNSVEITYEPNTSGVITWDRIHDLRGICIKVVNRWMRIKEVRREGDTLVFSVGVSSASFPVDKFYVSPKCGCGFNCGKVKVVDHGMNQEEKEDLDLFS